MDCRKVNTIACIDPDLAVANVLTMDQILGQPTIDASFDATLLFAFAVISLVLAAVGLFGVLSLTSQRTTEIGIRIALGAQREQVMRLMLRDGLRPAIFGLVLGLIASAGVARLIQPMLRRTPAVRSNGLTTRQRDAAFGRNLGMHSASMASLSRLDPMIALGMD